MTNNELRDAFTYLYQTAKKRNDSWRRMAHQISQEWGDGSKKEHDDVNSKADEVDKRLEEIYSKVMNYFLDALSK